MKSDREAFVLMHQEDAWRNPDDFSVNRVSLIYASTQRVLRILMEQNEKQGAGVNRDAVDIKDNSEDRTADDLEPEAIQHHDIMFDENKPHFVVAVTDIKRSDAVQLFQKFDYDLNAMVHHLYLDTTDSMVG